MAQRRSKMSKKEFDDQFEAFLKESMSSEESMDSARVSKYLNPTRKEKSWWMEQDDEDEEDIGRGLTASGKSFFKKKKPEPETSTPIREDQTTSIRDKKLDLDSSDDGKKIGSPAERRAKNKRELKAKGVRGKTDNSMSKDSLEDISEKSEEESTKHNDRKGFSGTRSSHEHSSGQAGKTGRATIPGMETLDEIAEKEKFFQDLENAAGETLDYSRMNRDLSQSATTMSPEGAAKAAATLAALEDIEQEEEGSIVPPTKSEPITDQDPSVQKPSMLSKVSLMDSMESTMNTTGSPKVGGTLQEPRQSEGLDDIDGQINVQQSTPGSFKTGTGFMGTNTSNEIEALHKALREVGLSPTIKNDSQGLDSSMANNTDLLQKILSTEPEQGKQRTVEEVLQEMDNIEKRNRSQTNDPDVQLLSDKKKTPADSERRMEDIRGFGLSPIQQEQPSPQGFDPSPRGFDESHTEDTEMYQPVTQISKGSKVKSISERGRTKKKDSKDKNKNKKMSPSSPGRSLSPRSSPRRWISPRSNTAKLGERSRSLSPSKPGVTAFNGATLRNKYSHIKSSGYGQQSPGRTPSRERPSSAKERGTLRTDHRGAQQGERNGAQDRARKKERKPRDAGKRQEQTWSPADIARQKVMGTESPKQSRGHLAGLDSQLRVSIESFAAYIADHFSPTRKMPKAKYSEDEPSLASSWKGDKSAEGLPNDPEELQKVVLSERSKNLKLKEELERFVKLQGHELEKLKLKYEEEIHNLKQENYVLSARVPGDKEELKKQLMNGAANGISSQQIESLKKELEEQENLIAGYQQENQRLYDQVKALQKKAKVTEERMFTENQRLQTELTNLRAKTNVSDGETVMTRTRAVVADRESVDVNAALGVGQIAELEAELREHQRREVTMKRELEIAQRTKIEMDQQMDKLIKERELLHDKLDKASYPEDVRQLEDKYKEEIDRLSRKLKWYAENQKLLDQDAKKLKSRDEEIAKLKSRIQDFQTETGKRLEENKMRSTERAKDAKKIQDLQRQVKEMEAIMKRRHPNSLPSLMMTAAVIPGEQDKSPLVTVLEGRVRKLEQELESKEKEEDKMLRAVEQKYNNIKLKFEERIHDLETQLAAYQRPDDQNLKSYEHPHTHTVALQQELDATRDRYKKQVADLEEQVSTLNSQLQQAHRIQEGPMSEVQASKEKEVELSSKLQLLQLELNSQNHDLQVLHKSLERLRKEKQNTLVNSLSQDKKKKKNREGVDAEKLLEIPESVRKEPCDHEDEICRLVQENEGLRAKMDELQLEAEHSRLKVHKVQAEHEAYVRKSRENYEKKIEALCQSHQKELQQMLAEQALEHSASKTAHLYSKVNAQEVMIQHLRNQLTEAQEELEQMSILKIKEAAHVTQIEKLQQELREAKKHHSPGMKHFEQIEDKILSIENKHKNREKELQQVIQNSKDSHTKELEQQTAKWKQVVEVKNKEIQKFRVELDAILDVLRLLQKQGVVLPVRTSHTYS